MMNQQVGNTKNNNGRFNFFHSKEEYKSFLKKFKGDVSELNKAIKKTLFDFMNKNKSTCYEENRKQIYISAEENETIANWCNTKQISRSKLSEMVKEDFKKQNINSNK